MEYLRRAGCAEEFQVRNAIGHFPEVASALRSLVKSGAVAKRRSINPHSNVDPTRFRYRGVGADASRTDRGSRFTLYLPVPA
jgi:hypothetical protein